MARVKQQKKRRREVTKEECATDPTVLRVRSEDVQIEDVQVGERRPVNPDKVKMLAESIREIGLHHPIGITEDGRLIHGLHRIEAYKVLGRATIPALIHSLDSLHAGLAEIDENLLRHPLTDLEEGQALKRRKEIYEALHPETKHGGDRKSRAAKSKRQNGALKSFAQDTADRTGRSKRSVQRTVAIAENIDPDVQEQLKDTPVANNKTEWERISKLPPDEQKRLVITIKQAKPPAARGRKKAKPKTTLKGGRWQSICRKVEELAKELRDWAGDGNDRRFVARRAEKLIGLVAKLEKDPKEHVPTDAGKARK